MSGQEAVAADERTLRGEDLRLDRRPFGVRLVGHQRGRDGPFESREANRLQFGRILNTPSAGSDRDGSLITGRHRLTTCDSKTSDSKSTTPKRLHLYFPFWCYYSTQKGKCEEILVVYRELAPALRPETPIND